MGSVLSSSMTALEDKIGTQCPGHNTRGIENAEDVADAADRVREVGIGGYE